MPACTLVALAPPSASAQETVIPSAQTVGDVGEFGVIARVTRALAGDAPSEHTLLGPGDDAAVVVAADGRVVAGTDVLVENSHFRRAWSSAEDVGHKAAAKNLADIVAMGARPTALLVGLGAPADLPIDWIDGLVLGLRAEAAAVGAAIVGGDVVEAPQVIVSVTALGDLQGREPVTLSGARAGDVVALSGRVGWAAAGFAVLSRGFRSPVQVVSAHRRPEPPYTAGVQAAEWGATSMTDVSDGLVADLGHIAAASGVRLEINSAALGIPSKLAEVGAALNVDPHEWLLNGGDDYALVATFPPGVVDDVDDGTWRAIGRVVPAGPSGPDVRVDGHSWAGGGHEHFARA